MYSWLKVIKQPLARPLMNRPAYNGPILSVAIMMMLEIQHSVQASHRHCLRPSLMAMNPAPPELMNAPSVMSEEISCWRSVLMFHPIGVFGALKPKTYSSFQIAINFRCRREIIPRESLSWPASHQSTQNQLHTGRIPRSRLHTRRTLADWR
jgi:hypothetical protein